MAIACCRHESEALLGDTEAGVVVEICGEPQVDAMEELPVLNIDGNKDPPTDGERQPQEHGATPAPPKITKDRWHFDLKKPNVLIRIIEEEDFLPACAERL